MTQTSRSSENIFSLVPFDKPLKSLVYNQRKVFNPHWFQGNRETKRYFEGWYFKNVSADQKTCWSFIPGVSLVDGDTHAFVQAINGQTGDTFYFRYPGSEFSFSSTGFEVFIGENYFSDKLFKLDLDDGENRFSGEICFENVASYPTWLSRPGIMGWYRYVPFMECYHGVVSLDHSLKGQLEYNGQKLDFNGGRGYIEKDWGSSMPKSWIWMQSNHFETPATSFMISVARIPWVRNTFTGFLGFFLHDGKIISFATYTGAVIKDLQYTDSEVRLQIKGSNHLIEVHAIQSERSGNKAGRKGLKAPVFGNMDRVIHESIDGEINLKITDTKGNLVFMGTGHSSGFEMVGDLELLKQ
jgi:tocopherol cyclase